MAKDTSREEKLGKIITQTENYLHNVGRFYPEGIYIDKGHPEERKSVSQVKENSDEVKGVKKERKSVKEVDLFGNETIKKEDWEFAESLEELNEMISGCKKCPLWETRTNFVFGVGNPKADIVVIGEAPGADEDAQGEPFVGRAGQLLNKILEATGFKREEVFICN